MPAPRANGHEARRELTRRAIVDSAVELFDTLGYDRTTVALIARGAHVSERTVYGHFPTKEDLLFAHAREFADLARSVADRTESPDPSIRVRAAVEALVLAATTERAMVQNSRLRAIVASRGRLPRSLMTHLTDLAQDLARRVSASTGTPLERVAPMVGAVLGAVGAAGLLAASDRASPSQARDAMMRACDTALVGFGSPEMPR